MKIYEIGTGYTPIPAQIAAATESVVEELTRAFMKMGQSVEIIDIATKNRVLTDLPIQEVKVPSLFQKTDVGLGLIHKLKRVVYSVSLSSWLKKMLKAKSEEKVVLHFHNQYNLFFFLKFVSAKLRSRAVIAYTNHNGMWSLPWDESKNVLQKRYFQEIYAMKHADIVFALNCKMKENIITHLGLSPQKVHQINNGVNTDVYFPLSEIEKEKIKSELGLSGKRVILQVGSVNENKGQARSVRLLAPLLKEISNLVFAYAGEVVSQDYQQLIKSTAEELGVAEQVLYLGAFSPGEEMNRVYGVSNLTLFVSNYEGFALVCVESLACGIPVVIASDMQLSIGDGCIESDWSDFSKLVENVLSIEKKTVEKISRDNVLKNYRWEKIASDYQEIMNQYLKKQIWSQSNQKGSAGN